MADELIRQRKRLAMGESLVEVPAIPSPFQSGFDHGGPPRGTMLDSQRGASRGGKISHGSTGYDD